MVGSFRVVTDTKRIAALNMELEKLLSTTFKHLETREITYPSGHFTSSIYFEHSTGADVRAWSPRKDDAKFQNFLLVGNPKSPERMQIEVQLNFPRNLYNRKMAGAFVTDIEEKVFVAHRGKLTKGKAGLPKEKVFREFASRVISADDIGSDSQLILIGALQDAKLVDRLWAFADEARRVATKIAREAEGSADSTSGSEPGSVPGASGNGDTGFQDRVEKLRNYFDEHSGEGTYKGHDGGTRTVEHGDIVRALEEVVRLRGTTQKSQAIDLAVVATNEVDLFEVKTSSRTTDVYTGLGQLLIHGSSISELLNMNVERILVVPENPTPIQARQIHRNGFKIVTFKRFDDGYTFSGL